MILVHYRAYRFETRMLVDHRRLRVCMAQGAHNEGQITCSSHDLRRERVAGTVKNDFLR
jgi:hypothetical protein